MWDPACCHLTKPSKRVCHHRGHNVHLRVTPFRRACLRGRSERRVFVWSLSGPYLDSKHHLYSDLNGLLAPDISGAVGDNRTASAADSLKNFVPILLSCVHRAFPSPCETCLRKAALQTHRVQRMPPPQPALSGLCAILHVPAFHLRGGKARSPVTKSTSHLRTPFRWALPA